MDDAPGIQIVDELIRQALAYRASDIHIESQREGLRVRYRIDDLLVDHAVIDAEFSLQVLARIKVLAHIDVAERRIPQDGKFCLSTPEGIIDIRIATFPSLYGEKIALRILRQLYGLLDLDQIGIADIPKAQFKFLIERAQGFVLVTGPTGSGKTTTLYAALAALQSPEKNIITLEDPIEYTIDGITQSQVYPDIGFTFEKGIRAILRQDPDVIMVGEIRDQQTAEVALQAALTGHLVLSTLHTNDAPSTIIRLLDMGIPAFLINASLTCILAQRLVRKLCVHCRREVAIDAHEQELLSSALVHSYRADGCQACNRTGYYGRIGIFELLTLSPHLRALITSNPSYDELYRQACADGMISLWDDATAQVNAGRTSISEILRVIR